MKRMKYTHGRREENGYFSLPLPLIKRDHSREVPTGSKIRVGISQFSTLGLHQKIQNITQDCLMILPDIVEKFLSKSEILL